MTITISQNREFGPFNLINGWLKKNISIFIGRPSLLLFPTAYLATDSQMTGTTFVTPWYTF
jgi:hypothetical protein